MDKIIDKYDTTFVSLALICAEQALSSVQSVAALQYPHVCRRSSVDATNSGFSVFEHAFSHVSQIRFNRVIVDLRTNWCSRSRHVCYFLEYKCFVCVHV